MTQELTSEQIDAIADQLSNNEFDSDSSLKLLLMKEYGIPDTVAYQAVKLRESFLTDPLADLRYENGRLTLTSH